MACFALKVEPEYIISYFFDIPNAVFVEGRIPLLQGECQQPLVEGPLDRQANFALDRRAGNQNFF